MKNNIYSFKVVVEGGKGGDGLVSFLRVAHQPRGGPDGGDGGKGGDVLMKAYDKYHSLEYLHYEPIIKASNGAPGHKNKKHGKNGKNKIILVPPGTTIYNCDKKELIVDMVSEGMEIELVKGGKGGQGNVHFTTPTNQTPRIATPGKEGEKKTLILEYSPLIDVAVIGLVNAGKSSIIEELTGCTTQISNYPFTTRNPHLWSCLYNYNRFTFLDTPPLFSEYSSDIEILTRRASVLIIIFDGSNENIYEQSKLLEEKFLDGLIDLEGKSIVIVLNKVDKISKKVNISFSYPIFLTSIKNNKGIEELRAFIFEKLEEKKNV